MSFKSALVQGSFWVETIDRAIKTAAQDIIKWLTVGEFMNLVGIDWKLALGVAGYGAVLSVLTSIASAGVSDNSPTALDKALLD